MSIVVLSGLFTLCLFSWPMLQASEARPRGSHQSEAAAPQAAPHSERDHSSALASSLVADYQFRDSLNSSVGNAPALTNLGNNSFESVTVDDSIRRALKFDENNGLALAPTSGAIPSQSYTVVMLFAFTNVNNARRILDFKNGTSDSGLYCFFGELAFRSPSLVRGGNSIAPNVYVQVALTRDTAGNVAGYVNGVRQLNFVDSAGAAVIDSSNALRFFRDNTGGSPVGEASAGSVARIRLYNVPLSSNEIASLDRLPNQQAGCPSVSGISPTSGESGVRFVITGSSLNGVTAVKFPNNVAANFTVNDESQITVTVPNGAATGTLTLSKPGCADIQTSAVFAVPSSAATTLVADYQFQDSLNSSAGNPPALTNLGNNSFETVAIDASSRRALKFDENNGVALFSTAGLVSNQAYTVVMLFAFTSVNNARRILDFKNGTSDSGLYCFFGELAFRSPSLVRGGNSIAPNAYVQVALTRDTAGNVAGYVNGVRQLSFVDPSGVATIEGNTLRFFRDNTGGSSVGEASAGQVARIRLYNVALSSSEVAALDRLPAPSSLSSVSAASFAGANLATESIVAAFGTGLATAVQTASTLPLPTSLAGTTVRVRDSAGTERLAPLFFVAPAQINCLIPPNTTAGAATITVTSGDGRVSVSTVQIAAIAPGLFSANASGQGIAAAVALRVKADGSQVYEPISRFDQEQNKYVALPIDLGPASDQVFLVLYGTGIRFRSSLSGVAARIGGVDAQVLYAGLVDGFVGLDQVNLRVPRSLAGRGEADIVITADGMTTNTVLVNIGPATSLTPTITSVTPNSVTAGGPAFLLNVSGHNFVSGSIVRWNGNPRKTTFVGSTQLIELDLGV